MEMNFLGLISSPYAITAGVGAGAWLLKAGIMRALYGSPKESVAIVAETTIDEIVEERSQAIIEKLDEIQSIIEYVKNSSNENIIRPEELDDGEHRFRLLPSRGAGAPSYVSMRYHTLNGEKFACFSGSGCCKICDHIGTDHAISWKYLYNCVKKHQSGISLSTFSSVLVVDDYIHRVVMAKFRQNPWIFDLARGIDLVISKKAGEITAKFEGEPCPIKYCIDIYNSWEKIATDYMKRHVDLRSFVKERKFIEYNQFLKRDDLLINADPEEIRKRRETWRLKSMVKLTSETQPDSDRVEWNSFHEQHKGEWLQIMGHDSFGYPQTNGEKLDPSWLTPLDGYFSIGNYIVIREQPQNGGPGWCPAMDNILGKPVEIVKFSDHPSYFGYPIVCPKENNTAGWTLAPNWVELATAEEIQELIKEEIKEKFPIGSKVKFTDGYNKGDITTVNSHDAISGYPYLTRVVGTVAPERLEITEELTIEEKFPIGTRVIYTCTNPCPALKPYMGKLFKVSGYENVLNPNSCLKLEGFSIQVHPDRFKKWDSFLPIMEKFPVGSWVKISIPEGVTCENGINVTPGMKQMQGEICKIEKFTSVPFCTQMAIVLEGIACFWHPSYLVRADLHLDEMNELGWLPGVQVSKDSKNTTLPTKQTYVYWQTNRGTCSIYPSLVYATRFVPSFDPQCLDTYEVQLACRTEFSEGTSSWRKFWVNYRKVSRITEEQLKMIPNVPDDQPPIEEIV